jgi:hypothetical protein
MELKVGQRYLVYIDGELCDTTSVVTEERENSYRLADDDDGMYWGVDKDSERDLANFRFVESTEVVTSE